MWGPALGGAVVEQHLIDAEPEQSMQACKHRQGDRALVGVAFEVAQIESGRVADRGRRQPQLVGAGGEEAVVEAQFRCHRL